MANQVQVTKNKTRVLDPGADSAPLVVVYRGLGPEYGKAYAYDTADWMISQIQKAIPKETLNKIIFAVPDDYNQDCEQCIQQANELVEKRKGKIGFYSLCGFSKGGAPVYKNLSRRTWKILGLIDPVSPSMEGISDKAVDDYASKIRCVYGVSHWGTQPPKDKLPKDYGKDERVYVKTRDFYGHLKALRSTEMIRGTRTCPGCSLRSTVRLFSRLPLPALPAACYALLTTRLRLRIAPGYLSASTHHRASAGPRRNSATSSGVAISCRQQ